MAGFSQRQDLEIVGAVGIHVSHGPCSAVCLPAISLGRLSKWKVLNPSPLSGILPWFSLIWRLCSPKLEGGHHLSHRQQPSPAASLCLSLRPPWSSLALAPGQVPAE